VPGGFLPFFGRLNYVELKSFIGGLFFNPIWESDPDLFKPTGISSFLMFPSKNQPSLGPKIFS